MLKNEHRPFPSCHPAPSRNPRCSMSATPTASRRPPMNDLRPAPARSNFQAVLYARVHCRLIAVPRGYTGAGAAPHAEVRRACLASSQNRQAARAGSWGRTISTWRSPGRHVPGKQQVDIDKNESMVSPELLSLDRGSCSWCPARCDGRAGCLARRPSFRVQSRQGLVPSHW